MTTVGLLDTHEWLGEFWFAKDPERKFPGIVRCSPQGGLLLTTSEAGRHFEDRGEKVETMYGVTHETGPLSLLGAFPLGSGTYKTGALRRRIYADAAIWWGHFDEHTRFRRLVFEANNLQEFFQPRGLRSFDGYTGSPFLSGNTEDPERSSRGDRAPFSVSVTKDAVGVFLPPEVAKAFVLDEDQDAPFIDDLNAAVDEVRAKHGQTSLVARKEITYRIEVEATDPSGASYFQFKGVIFEICQLLSLLFLKPVRPTIVRIEPIDTASTADGTMRCPVVMSLLLSDRQLKSIERDKGHHFELPVTSSALAKDYQAILRNWFDFVAADLNIVWPTLRNHIDGQPEYLQEYVLLAASIEQCCVLEGGAPNDRYNWFVDKYCSDQIVERFLAYLPQGTAATEIGTSLAVIRNCIVHPPKVKEAVFSKFRAALDRTPLCNLSELIFLSLVTYVYQKIGLPNEAVDQFSEHIDRHMRITVSG